MVQREHIPFGYWKNDMRDNILQLESFGCKKFPAAPQNHIGKQKKLPWRGSGFEICDRLEDSWLITLEANIEAGPLDQPLPAWMSSEWRERIPRELCIRMKSGAKEILRVSQPHRFSMSFFISYSQELDTLL
jgi:hypothetical protein